jgi:hypothetical protein
LTKAGSSKGWNEVNNLTSVFELITAQPEQTLFGQKEFQKKDLKHTWK